MAADDFLRGPSETAGQVWEGVSRRFAQRKPFSTWRLREQMFFGAGAIFTAKPLNFSRPAEIGSTVNLLIIIL